jgi:integrase/recombinase XerD
MEQSHDVRLKENSSAAVTNDVDQCLNAFDRHLESERGCALGTRAHYLREARCFLVDVFPNLKTNWEGLNADHVAGFVLRRAEKLSRLSQQGPVTAIRSLLRFLTFEGQIRTGLEGAVPPLRGSRHASIPRHLSPEQLDFVLTLCPSDNALDKRNRAMLLLLAKLGLRAGEVFRVSLDNLNWTGGAVLIKSSKTARERILPMPEDVGSSLAAYLTKGRPPSSERLVFLSHHPPYQPLRSTGVLSSFVNSLLKQAGILAPCSGAHVHTTAMHLLQSGVDITVIALWLGHESLETTHIYIEADLPMKQQALEKVEPAGQGFRRFTPPDDLLAFLSAL